MKAKLINIPAVLWARMTDYINKKGYESATAFILEAIREKLDRTK